MICTFKFIVVLAIPRQLLCACIEAFDKWMGSKRYKTNSEETQLIWLSSRQQPSHIIGNHCNDTMVLLLTPSTSFRNFGVIFDSNMTIADHVNGMIRAYFYQLRQHRFAWCCLSNKVAKMLVHAFISSRVDYCNIVPYGTTSRVTRKLLAVLNAVPIFSRDWDALSTLLLFCEMTYVCFQSSNT